MQERYPRRDVQELVDYHTFGERGKVAVKHELTRTRIGFRIPSDEKRAPGVVVQFSNVFRTPHFTVQAEPFDAEELMRSEDPEFVEASRRLQTGTGFKHDRGYWAHVHTEDEWLHEPDVPAVLARLAAADVATIVASGIFDLDVRQPSRARRFRIRRHSDDEPEAE
jgi:hypothetical protein